MKVGIPAERRDGERRVACVPQTVSTLVGAGLTVVVQAGAGHHAHATDDDYRSAGASITQHDPVSEVDVVVSVQPLAIEQAKSLQPGTITVGFLPPTDLDLVRVLVDRETTALSLDLLPRLSRAQGMDALSSQALVAGYRAVLVAAERLPRFFPMFITAAGTIAPAKVLVLGAGVAGLQAIATARRLGAVVEAYDVRAAAAEEVRSLGARFLDLGLETQDGNGGYASAQSEEFLARQRERIGQRVAASDVVITTAAVPGRTAPVLVTKDMVEAMAPGTVVVDLAAESGGNCELSIPGKEFRHGDVLIYGARNLPSQMAVHASQLYAKNAASLLLLMASEGQVRPDFTDEIVSGCCLTHAGEVRHEPTRALLQGGMR